MSRYTPPKRVTIADQKDWQHSLLTKADLDEINEIDPLVLDHPPQRRKSSEISSLDAIFAELERRGA